MTRDEVRARIRSDYLQLPGLKLTAAQAARFWAIGQEIAGDVLDDLTSSGLLVCRNGEYERR